MRKRCELESYNFLYNFSILNTNLFLLNLKLHDWLINYDAFKCWIAIGWPRCIVLTFIKESLCMAGKESTQDK